MFSQACIIPSVHRGVCMAGVCVWQGACMVGGIMCGRETCMAGGGGGGMRVRRDGHCSGLYAYY